MDWDVEIEEEGAIEDDAVMMERKVSIPILICSGLEVRCGYWERLKWTY